MQVPCFAVMCGMAMLVLAPGTARAQDQWAPPTPHVADPNAEPPPPPPPPPPAHVALRDGAHFAAPGELCYPAPPPGQTHDGFYLRLQIGGGYVTGRQGDTHLSGGAMAFGFAIGAVVLPNLALVATFTFHEAPDPTARTSGGSTTLNDDTLGSESFGAGLVYYVEPFNAYVSASVLDMTADITDAKSNQLASSNDGIGFDVMVGKEWWVGREWGLGAAAEFTAGWMTDANDSSTRWNSFTYSLLFSATYN